ncbi:MAG: hypothetical protein Q8T08_20285, partial [Ignavibacteria bacterium]|nr:hypothetical protein [Ignavibacteria bacterium]
ASDKGRSDKNVQFAVFPSASEVAGDRAVITSFNATFLIGNDPTTNASTVYFIPYIGFGGQYGFQLWPDIWLNKNSWNFKGEYFILNYPQNTWGLGGNTPESNETLIDYQHLRIYQKVMKGILPQLAIGIGYALDKHFNITLEETVWYEEIKDYLPNDRNYSVSSGLILPIVYDSRRNSMNPQKGMLAQVNYSFYNTALGSENNWQSLFIDFRKYVRIIENKKQILAFRSYYWTILSGKVPYLDLPAVRWEPTFGSASRGIAQSRYRSNAIVYYENEYRFPLTANGLIGGVVFASVTSVSQYKSQNFMYWHPAAGFGFRLKFNKYSNTNVTLDFGFSKEYFSLYLNIGEVF